MGNTSSTLAKLIFTTYSINLLEFTNSSSVDSPGESPIEILKRSIFSVLTSECSGLGI